MRNNIRNIVLVILVISTFILSGCDLFIKTNDGKVDLKWYMGLTYEDENGEDIEYTTKSGDSIVAVALEEEYSSQYAIMKDVDVYVNIDMVKDNIDDRFYFDSKNEKVLFTNATTVYEIPLAENVVNGENVEYTTCIKDEEQCYINIELVKRFVDINYKVSKAEGDIPPLLSITYKSGEKEIMSTTDDIEMRTKGDYQNLIVTEVPEGTEVTVIEKTKNWNKVRTDSGYIGYIPVSKLEDAGTKEVTFDNDDDTYTHVTLDEKVSLAWNQVYNQSANDNLDELIANVKGVNVISPTWFSLVDKNGNLSSLADLNYVEKAHAKGMQVWALVNDFTDRKLTKKVLTSTELRNKLVDNIMYFVSSYELDGVNIDFEYITEEIADDYLQFLRELSIACRKAEKVLSIDNYAPSEWSTYYDRKQQIKLADYIIIMNYDEHTTTSEEAGSVSSLTYAENSIKETIDETGNADRIINGMPFYTRIWETKSEEDGNEDGSGKLIEDAVNGNYYLSSQAVGMNAAEEAYKEAGATPAFDETTGQNYVTYSKGSSTYMIWLEDETSVEARLELMNQYNLAGAAYWSLGQEKDSIWKTIKKYFNE